MEKRLKNKVSAISLMMSIVCLCLLAFFYSRQVWQKGEEEVQNQEIPTVRLQASFSIDPGNLKELVGDADYVFAGKVTEETGTEYKYPISIEISENETREVASPYTNYMVRVTENIKGDLIMDQDIPIQKAGGILEDGSMYELYEGDELPAVGETYIFFAYAQEDGSLLISGPNSNQKVDSEEVSKSRTKSTRSTDTVYEQTLEAYEQQIVTDRKRYTSSYEGK